MIDSKLMTSTVEIALAEFLRGKMQRLRNSYTLAFEAGWSAHSASSTGSPNTSSPAMHGLNTSLPEPVGGDSAAPLADKAPLSEWIKCSDRLPGDRLDGLGVIVAVVDHRGYRISELDVWNKGCRQGRFEFWGKRVTHWQPLPAPPGHEQ